MMTDRVIYKNDGSGNTLLIVVVLVILVIIGFLVYSGRLGNVSPQESGGSSINLNVDTPDGSTTNP